MLESTKTPISQFGLNKTLNEDKGFCFGDLYQQSSSSFSGPKTSCKKIFMSPKFIASKLEVVNKMPERESISPKKAPLSKTVGFTEKVGKKPIEVIEENPYIFDGANENDSSSDIDQDQMVFIGVQAANAQNIFRQQKRDPNFSEYNIGPRFANDGKVIKRSIVGKPDTFIKMQNILFKSTDGPNQNKERKTSILMKGSTIKDGKPGQINKSYTSLNSTSSINIDEGVDAGKKKKPARSTISTKKAENETGKFHFMTRIGKDDLIQDIEKAEQRQATNNINDQKLLSALPKSDKRFFTREQRIFERFNKTQEIWQKKTEAIAKKLKRRQESCVISKTDEYRLKLENAQALDLLKNDDEKYGNKYWYLTLREYPTDYRPETYTVFKKSQLNFNKNNLEIVRKRVEDGEPKSPKKILTVYGENEYLDQKLKKNKKKLEVILPTDDDNFLDMQVKP